MILQQRFACDPWKLLVACILLNLTGRKQVDGVIDALFETWPSPAHMQEADAAHLAEVLRPLGLQNRRASTLIRMSSLFLAAKRETNRGVLREEDVKRLPGVGPYALDSYRFFILGDTSRFESGDKVLAGWLRQREWQADFGRVAEGALRLW